MTREYPPEVYGGAGVHVTELVAQLRQLCEVDVHCMGAPRPGGVRGPARPRAQGRQPCADHAVGRPGDGQRRRVGATVVHSHTWYAGLAGHLAALLYGVPHVLTAHSLEPMRPWKAEQLGGGYRVSSWVERTAVEAADAVIAVSSGMRDDVLATYPALDPNRVHVVRNGIDTQVWYPGRAAAGRVGARRPRRRPDASRSWPSSAGSPGRRASRTSSRPRTGSPPRCSWCCARARRTPPRSPPRSPRRSRSWRPSRTGVFWVREMLPTTEDPRNTFGGNGFRVPLGVRAAGHRESRGDGVRDGGGRFRRRRHPRGGGRRYDRAAGALRPGRHRVLRDPTRRRGQLTWSPSRSGPSSTGGPVASAASTSSPGRTSPSRRSRSTARSPRREVGVSGLPPRAQRAQLGPAATGLAGDALEFVAEGGGLIRSEFDDETPAALQWYPHHDASPLLGCFQWTVAGPGLHRRHRVLPPHAPARVSGTIEAKTAHPATAPGTELQLNFLHCSLSSGVRCAKTRRSSPGDLAAGALTP